jgi:hypothetical protein
MGNPPAHSLTAVRLERLRALAIAIPSLQLGSPPEEVFRAALDLVGGTLEEISGLAAFLGEMGLCCEVEGALRRTKDGDRIARAIRSDDMTLLGRAIIRSGVLHEQARHLLECGEVRPDGSLACELRNARDSAPQLVGLLQWWPEVETSPALAIPKPLVDELNSVWSLLPPAPETPAWVVERKAVGNRAEMYTVHMEKLIANDPAAIVWVARDSDGLGWDVEDRGTSQLRRIEVKGSRNVEPVFLLSENEWQKASEHADSYEIHFWGGVDLSRQPAEEFLFLRREGFPIVIRNIVAEVDGGKWRAKPALWRITRADES